MNNFLGGGGDGFSSTITAGTHIKFGADDLVALEAYLQPTVAGTPYNPDLAITGPHRVLRAP